jgi:hypothetical protein
MIQSLGMHFKDYTWFWIKLSCVLPVLDVSLLAAIRCIKFPFLAVGISGICRGFLKMAIVTDL